MTKEEYYSEYSRLKAEIDRNEKIHCYLVANRYRRDQNVPSIYRMPNPRELGRAIDYAIRYMKGEQ